MSRPLLLLTVIAGTAAAGAGVALGFFALTLAAGCVTVLLLARAPS